MLNLFGVASKVAIFTVGAAPAWAFSYALFQELRVNRVKLR
jgi:hypothetical protein